MSTLAVYDTAFAVALTGTQVCITLIRTAAANSSEDNHQEKGFTNHTSIALHPDILKKT